MSTVTIGKIHVGESGTEFQLEILETTLGGDTVPKDLTGSTVEMIFTDTSGTETTFTATIIIPALEGVITFTNTNEQFFNDSGYWFYRARIINGESIFISNSVGFEVLGNQQ